jgi:predicted DNA-binding transcriptional regulator YafY
MWADSRNTQHVTRNIIVNRIDRLTGILLLLQDQPRTAADIARHFEVSRRTILRDVQALCEIGVPVVAREGVGGGYSLPEGYRPAPLPLSTNEVFLLLMALSTIARLADTPFGQARATLAAKLRALLPGEQLPNVERMLTTVGVEVPERSERAPLLDALIAAAQEQRWMRVVYRSAERRSTQHLLPRQIFAQQGYWYCRAYAAEHATERMYRVDRMEAIEPPSDDFRPPLAPDPLPYDHESHPQVVVTLTARGVATAESDPHIGRQIERTPDGAGRLVFRCPPDELDWYARYFASLGANAEVRAPAELRERIRQIALALLTQYQSQSE